jgi:hypothetical protein
MAQIAPASTPPRRDRTTLVVRLGLLTLLLLGVITVFGESLGAVLFPPGETPTPERQDERPKPSARAADPSDLDGKGGQVRVSQLT